MNDIAKENNQNFYVIVLPRSPEYRKRLKEYAIKENYNYDEIFKPLNDMAEKYNLKVLNHFYDENFTDDEFVDYEHFIPSGAIKFTNMLLKEIQ